MLVALLLVVEGYRDCVIAIVIVEDVAIAIARVAHYESNAQIIEYMYRTQSETYDSKSAVCGAFWDFLCY